MLTLTCRDLILFLLQMLHTLGLLKKMSHLTRVTDRRDNALAENLCGKDSSSEKAFFVIPGT